jgi:hypothetical protein
MNAATVIVKIRYCIWREGRPRFVPGPGLQKLGFKSRDLKHPSGTWFTLDETKLFSDNLLKQAKGRKDMKEQGKRLPPIPKARVYTVAQLFKDLFEKHPRMGSVKSKQKQLAKDTVRNYRNFANTLMQHDPEVWASPVLAISHKVAWQIYNTLYTQRGLHVARHVIATCRMAWSWACKEGMADANPFMRLGMETPQGRVRVASADDLRYLISLMDVDGRHDVADLTLLGLFTAQRQKDRLALEGGRIVNGRFHFTQSKTGKQIECPVIPLLAERLAANRKRREYHKLAWPHVVINETEQRPWVRDTFRHIFHKFVMKAAMERPSLAGFRDQDLRDTALSWAKQGGADFNARRQLSGHAANAEGMEEKHYTGAASQGDAAMRAIEMMWRK